MGSLSHPKLIVSGATGWLGHELLALLEHENSDQAVYDIVPISSKVRVVDVPSGRKLMTQTYEDLVSSGDVEGFVNLAFVTREKVAALGYTEYVLRNLDLISQACRVIDKEKPKWVVLVSSGAIFKNNSDELETDISRNPYGFLKRVEELLISDAAARIGANVVIGRLWGATGRYMPINRAYAISDFLCQALEGGPIRIRSGHRVFRRFCDAGEFMNVLIKLAIAGESRIFDSGGPLVEIGDLASEVARHFEAVSVIRAEPGKEPSDKYYPHSKDFEVMADSLGIGLTSISGQVRRTVSAHRSKFHLQDPIIN